MNKRIKKKQRLTALLYLLKAKVGLLERSNNLQQEVIEDYGHQLAEVKRELAELRAVVERNAQAANARFDYLEKKVADKVSKKSWFGRE